MIQVGANTWIAKGDKNYDPFGQWMDWYLAELEEVEPFDRMIAADEAREVVEEWLDEAFESGEVERFHRLLCIYDLVLVKLH